MKDLNEESNKVKNIIDFKNKVISEFKLPNSGYQPFFLKVLNDFIDFHTLPKNLPLPKGNMKLHLALSLILDVMVYSMGEDKRTEILKELNEYKMSLPIEYRD